jgi:hypothetical protein
MGNFSVRLTNEINIPGIAFINELAKEKNFNFSEAFTSAPDILKDLYYIFTKERDLGVDFVKSEHLLNRKIIEKSVLFRTMSSSENTYYLYNLNFLSKVKVEEILGFSPMDKALNVIMYATKLSKKDDDKYACKGTTSAGEEDEVTEDSLGKAIKKFSEPSEKSGEGQSELSDSLTSCVRDFLGDLTPEILSIYGATSKLNMPVNLSILKDIKIKAYLENKLGMQETKEKKVIEDSSSKTKQHMRMTKTSDVFKSNKAQMGMPDFNAKLAKKELIVSKKVSPVTKKQMFTMLLDDSGSMAYKMKQAYVRAVLLNRLESVVKGHATLIFYLYESGRYNKKVINTLVEARALYETICARIPNGGGTNIGYVLQETIDEVCAIPNYHNPEIMIVCDGDDYIQSSELDYKGVKISVVALGNSNPGLKDVAADSGGFYTEEKMY